MLTASVLIVALSGCSLLRRPMNVFTTPGPTAPVVLAANPTLDQVLSAVNSNTMRVTSYVTYDAKIKTPGVVGIPVLSAAIAAERPRNFRLRASTALTGPEIDLGSNTDEFWFWLRRSEPPTLFHCRHDQFETSPARDMLPVEPQWIADALGLVYLDPSLAYETPSIGANGNIELRSTLPHPSGNRSRVTVIDPQRAWVLEQHLYDSAGQLVASSRASEFRFDPTAQVSVPQRVAIQVPSQGLSFAIDLGNISINAYPGDAAQLWSRPQIEGTTDIDLASAQPISSPSAPPNGFPAPATNSQPPAISTAPISNRMPQISPSPVDTLSPSRNVPAIPVTGPSHLPPGGIALPQY